MHSKDSHPIFIVGSIIFLTIMSIIWGVSYAATVPADPTNLQQIQNSATYSNGISLSWTNNADSNLTQFILERKLSSDSTYIPLPNQFISPTTYNYTDQYNITSGVSYDYQIKACLSTSIGGILTTSPAGTATNTNMSEPLCSGYAEYKGAIVKAPNTQIVVSDPTNFTVVNNSTNTSVLVGLSWNDNSNNESIFKVVRTSSNGSAATLVVRSNSVVGTGIINYSDISGNTNIINREETYTYQIQACLEQTATGATPICSNLVSSTPTSILIPAINLIPSDPTELSVTYDGTTTSPSVALKWKHDFINENQFVIEKKSSTDALSTYIYLNKDTISYSDKLNITPNTNYYYRVKACNNPISATSLPADIIKPNCSNNTPFNYVLIPNITPQVTPPANPTNLILTLNSTTPSVSIDWTDNSSNEDKFIIEKKLSNEPTGKNFPWTGKDINHYEDKGVVRGLTYDYKVRACINATATTPEVCSLKYTDVKEIKIPVLITVAIPTNLKFNPSKLTLSTPVVELSFIDNSNNETIFNVKRMLTTNTSAPAVTFSQDSTTTIGTGSTILISDPNEVVKGSVYYYQVQACTALVTGITAQPCSSPVSISVTIPNTSIIPTVDIPTNLNATFNTAATTVTTPINLTWIDNSNNETKFVIERRLSSDITATPIYIDVPSNTTTSTGSLVSFSDINNSNNIISRGVIYYYLVRACIPSTSPGTTPFICSNQSNLKEVTIPFVVSTAILAPTKLNLYSVPDSNSTSIQLIWEDNSNGKAIFSVERKLSKETTYTTLPHYTNAGVNYYTDGGSYVIPGVSYDYRVKACVPATPTGVAPYNCSDPIELIGIIIPLHTNVSILPPTGLILSYVLSTDVKGKVQISWTDNSRNETKFIVERRYSSVLTSAPISTLEVLPSANFVVSTYESNVPRGVEYFYLVKACVLSSETVVLTGGATEICSNPSEIKSIKIPYLTINTNATPDNTSTENPVKTIIDNINKVIPVVIPNQNSEISPTPNVATEVISKDAATIVAINEVSVHIQDVSLVIDELKNSINITKDQLISLINDSVSNIINNSSSEGKKIDTIKINTSRDELISKVESNLANTTSVTPEDINNLKNEINKGIEDIKILAGESTNGSQPSTNNSNNIASQLNTLATVVQQNNDILKDRGGDLIYKDTNKDGISDYDSTYVYNIDPIKPSLVSTYEGRKITASEKVLLGFDPSVTELVKVNKEQPVESKVAVVPTYKVKEVKLTEKKQIALGGQALPNSFITLYIYSTPIIVTVKTDNNGEWQYLLDKELENGTHTVYTATVNNTGNIVAKSSGYLFTKTAEAISFQDVPIAEASINVAKPGLLEGASLYLAIAAFVLIVISVIVLIGVISKKNNQNQNLV